MSTSKRHPPDRSDTRGIPTDTQFLFPSINDKLGSLRILEPIAAGGMAVVYKVLHEELEVKRAVKVLKPGFTEETRQRLFTEAKISANLHHPNIVQIYNVGLWHESVPFIEMEYVRGNSLKDLLSESFRLPFLVAASIGAILCKALDFARRQTFTVYGKSYHGLVHRDIKPANVLISPTGDVKLADFGIALPGSVSIHTTDSVIMGTSPYLSPEQIRGEQLDHRSDIYSLGTVLYELLCGEKAFPQPMMPTLMTAKLEGKYEPLKSVTKDIPPSLGEIVAKAMSVDKEKRFTDAGQMGDALEKLIAGFTDKPPSCIVRDFVSSTASESQGVVPYIEPSSNARFLWGILIAFSAMAILLGVVIALQDRLISTDEEAAHSELALANQDTISTSPVSENNQSAPSPRPAKSSVTTPAPNNSPEPRPDSSPAIVAPPEPSHTTPAASPSVSLDSIGSLLAHGKFQPVLENLAHLPLRKLSAQEQLRAEFYKIDALLSVGNYSEATKHARSVSNKDDAYYHLLHGRALQSQEAFHEARYAFQRAQHASSVAGATVIRQATYYLALNATLLYGKKPNAENRTDALKAWKEYSATYCTEGAGGGSPAFSESCARAHREITRLSRL